MWGEPDLKRAFISLQNEAYLRFTSVVNGNQKLLHRTQLSPHRFLTSLCEGFQGASCMPKTWQDCLLTFSCLSEDQMLSPENKVARTRWRLPSCLPAQVLTQGPEGQAAEQDSRGVHVPTSPPASACGSLPHSAPQAPVLSGVRTSDRPQTRRHAPKSTRQNPT